jgi:hypothetical protein
VDVAGRGAPEEDGQVPPERDDRVVVRRDLQDRIRRNAATARSAYSVTFYLYFSNKEDLFKALLKDALHDMEIVAVKLLYLVQPEVREDRHVSGRKHRDGSLTCGHFTADDRLPTGRPAARRRSH